MKQPRSASGRMVTAMVVCALVALVAFVLAAAFGEQPLDFNQVRTPGSTAELNFFSLRLPRVVLAALVGCALASSGAMLQSLLRNPLADPFVLGVSGGAALGATVALAFGLSALAWVPGLSAVNAFALLGRWARPCWCWWWGDWPGGTLPTPRCSRG